MNHLDDALENFCDHHWPCEFTHPRTGARCVNVRSGHNSKGHQSADGKVIATGNYISSFSFDGGCYLFRDWVYSCLVELLRELTTRVQNTTDDEERVAAKIHQTMVLTNLYSHIKHSDTTSAATNFMISHTSCYCCLFGQAEHFLPCGHVLCSACVRTYGHLRDPSEIEIFHCPIEGDENKRYPPWKIYLKPKLAGTRILVLDG